MVVTNFVIIDFFVTAEIRKSLTTSIKDLITSIIQYHAIPPVS